MRRPGKGAAGRPLVVSALGQKGGAGKSTLITCLGDLALRRGLRVLFVDADPQHTLMEWAAAAGAAGRRAPEVLSILEPHSAAGRFPGHDLVLIDSPGRLDLAQKSALLVTDLALIPAVPSPADLWALKDSVALVRDAEGLRPPGQLRLAIVLNRMTRSLIAGQTAGLIRAAAKKKDIPVLRAELGQRTAYVDALGYGVGPCTLEPKGAAAAEVGAVFAEVMGLLREEGRHAQPTA